MLDATWQMYNGQTAPAGGQTQNIATNTQTRKIRTIEQ
jgi:hypothetical protein